MTFLPLIESCHTLYTFYLFEFLAKCLHILDIVDIEPDVALEYSVLVLEFELLYVYVHLLRGYRGYFVYYAYAVDTSDVDGYYEFVCAVGSPLGCEYAVAVAALQTVCDGALALVYRYVLVLVVVGKYIVAGDGVTAIGYYKIFLKIIVCKTKSGLAVDSIECCDIILLFCRY